MKKKIYLILAVLISLMPLNSVRTTLYKIIFKYQINASEIGWLAIINIDQLVMEHAKIFGFNFFTGHMKVTLRYNSRIGSFNYFKCGSWVGTSDYKSELLLDEKSAISSQHYFDVAGRIYIGRKTIIAGVRSQFWTHGGMTTDVDINIGNNCYISSGVKFTPGTNIEDDTLCAMGSVVGKKFDTPNVLIAGVPAKVIKEKINWRENWK